MSAVEFDVGVPKECKSAGAMGRSYLSYPIVMKSSCSSGVVWRRYTDFEELRKRLVALYWYCVVPPLPEKETVLENIGITSGRDKVGQTRRYEFFLFLKRVYHHPVIRSDLLLSTFMRDENWFSHLRESQPALPFPTGATVFRKAFSSVDKTEEERAIDIQRHHINALRSHFDTYIRDEREAVHSLKKFGETFCKVRETDSDPSLQSAISSVEKDVDIVTRATERQNNLKEELLASINYLGNMCSSALEAIQNVNSAHLHVKRLTTKVDELKNTPSKANAGVTVVEKLRNMQAEKDKLTEILQDADKKHEEELNRFQRDLIVEVNVFLCRLNNIQQKRIQVLQETFATL